MLADDGQAIYPRCRPARAPPTRRASRPRCPRHPEREYRPIRLGSRPTASGLFVTLSPSLNAMIEARAGPTVTRADGAHATVQKP